MNDHHPQEPSPPEDPCAPPPTHGWEGLRQIDQRCALPKGSAFRAFKRQATGWQEGVDFRQLDPEADRIELDRLRRAGTVYANSPSPVLVSTAVARLLEAQMRSRITQPAE